MQSRVWQGFALGQACSHQRDKGSPPKQHTQREQRLRRGVLRVQHFGWKNVLMHKRDLPFGFDPGKRKLTFVFMGKAKKGG